MKILENADRRVLNYENVLHRFMDNEGLLVKFLLKFVEDATYSRLREAIASKDAEQSFKEAHTLKGVAANLGLTTLEEVSHQMTELLRAGRFEEAAKQILPLEAAYADVESLVEELKGVIG